MVVLAVVVAFINQGLITTTTLATRTLRVLIHTLTRTGSTTTTPRSMELVVEEAVVVATPTTEANPMAGLTEDSPRPTETTGKVMAVEPAMRHTTVVLIAPMVVTIPTATKGMLGVTVPPVYVEKEAVEVQLGKHARSKVAAAGVEAVPTARVAALALALIIPHNPCRRTKNRLALALASCFMLHACLLACIHFAALIFLNVVQLVQFN